MPNYSFGQVLPVTGLNIGFIGTISRMGSDTPVVVSRQVLPTAANPLSFGDVAIDIQDVYGGAWIRAADWIGLGSNVVALAGCTIINNQNIVEVPNVVGITIGMAVTGNNIAANTTVTAVNPLTSIVTMSSNANGNQTETVTFTNSASVSNIGLIYQNFAGIAVREVQQSLTYPATTVPGQSFILGSYAAGQRADVLERGSITVAVANGQPIQNGKVYMRVLANNNIAGTVVGDLEAVDDVVTSSLTATMVAGNTTLALSANTSVAAGQIVTGGSLLPGTCVISVGTNNCVVSAAPTAAAAAGTPVVFSNMLVLPDSTWRTGYIDANNLAELTIRNRHSA
jgi:hypothetical protein